MPVAALMPLKDSKLYDYWPQEGDSQGGNRRQGCWKCRSTASLKTSGTKEVNDRNRQEFLGSAPMWIIVVLLPHRIVTTAMNRAAKATVQTDWSVYSGSLQIIAD